MRPSLAGKNVAHLFLVAGRAEQGLVNALISREKLDPKSVFIYCVEGLTNFPDALRSLVSEREWRALSSVTILVDADEDPSARSQSIWDTLQHHAGLDRGRVEQAKRRGWLVDKGIRYALRVSPGGGGAGRIEDLVLRTIDREARRQIRELWRRSSVAKAREPSSKAEVAVVIALRTDQSLGLESAFEKGVFDLRDEAFGPMCALIRDQLGHRRS